jgi:CheY-like chemotaxis protein
MTLQKKPFEPRLLLADCIQAHQQKAVEKSVLLCVEVSPDLPREISGDPLRIRQILSNLVGDAVKFTEHGRVDVRLGGYFIQPGQFKLQITVQDSETGLGLAVTRGLEELPGGAVQVQSEQVQSELGPGTTFTVTLPCGAGTATGGEQETDLPVQGTSTPAAPAMPARILVVEDNHVNQKVVTAVLRKGGFSIELANDGQEALSKLETCAAFDLILMDVQMPVLDGLEATRLIRKESRWYGLPIIAMTAHAMSGDKERCLEAGMNGYISKPVHPSMLLRTLDEFLSPKIS